MDLFSIVANKSGVETTHYDKMVSTVDWIWTDEDYSVDIIIGGKDNLIMGYHHFDWVIDGLIIGKIYKMIYESPNGIDMANAVAIDGAILDDKFAGVTVLIECNEKGDITGNTIYAVSGARLISTEPSDPTSWIKGDYSELMTVNALGGLKEQGFYGKFTLVEYNGHVRYLKKLDMKYMPNELVEKSGGVKYTYEVPDGVLLYEQVNSSDFSYKTLDEGYSYYVTNVDTVNKTFQLGFGEEVFEKIFTVSTDNLLIKNGSMVYFKKRTDSGAQMYYYNETPIVVGETFYKGGTLPDNCRKVEIETEGTISTYTISTDTHSAAMLYQLLISPIPTSNFNKKVTCFVDNYETGEIMETSVQPIDLLGLLTSQLFGKEKEFFSLKFYNKTTFQFVGKRMFFQVEMFCVPFVETEKDVDWSDANITPRQSYTRKGFLELTSAASGKSFYETMSGFAIASIGNPGTITTVTWKE